MEAALPDSPLPLFSWMRVFVPRTPPMAAAAMTNASQPKVAVFQWLALQRPIRAAMLFERFRGDIANLLGSRSLLHLGHSRRRASSGMWPAGVWGCGYPHPTKEGPPWRALS